jgi:hypothetical protein
MDSKGLGLNGKYYLFEIRDVEAYRISLASSACIFPCNTGVVRL